MTRRPHLRALLDAPLRALALACALALPGAAHADDDAGAQAQAATQAASQALYLDAMQSISQGRQHEASDALTKMIEKEPQHAGAWLDLAIIQCELGHAEEAERLFRTIETRFSPPPGIMEVIALHRATGCRGWRPQSQLNLSLARGADSNVNQGASSPTFSIGSGASRIDLELLPEYRPQRDQYTLGSLDYQRELTTGGDAGFVQLRLRRNDRLRDYDTASLVTGVEHPMQVARWELRAVGSLAFLTLGNRLYQRQGMAQLRAVPPLPLSKAWRLSLLAGATHVEYPTLARFDSDTLELSSQLAYHDARLQAQAGLGFLADRGESGRLGGNRHGWFGTMQARMPLPRGLSGELAWTRQSWLGSTAYSPGLIDQVRRQDTQLVRGALVVPLSQRQALQLELRRVRNDENVPIFQYDSRLLQLSWLWQPF